MRTTAIRETPRAILRLLDPQKVKTSLVLMMGMLLVSGLVLLSAYLQARRQMEDTSRDLVARRAAENAVLLDRSLKSFQQTLYSLAVDKDIFWLKTGTSMRIPLDWIFITAHPPAFAASRFPTATYWVCSRAFLRRISCWPTGSTA